jgi:hypothetical protein
LSGPAVRNISETCCFGRSGAQKPPKGAPNGLAEALARKKPAKTAGFRVFSLYIRAARGYDSGVNKTDRFCFKPPGRDG